MHIFHRHQSCNLDSGEMTPHTVQRARVAVLLELYFRCRRQPHFQSIVCERVPKHRDVLFPLSSAGEEIPSNHRGVLAASDTRCRKMQISRQQPRNGLSTFAHKASAWVVPAPTLLSSLGCTSDNFSRPHIRRYAAPTPPSAPSALGVLPIRCCGDAMIASHGRLNSFILTMHTIAPSSL